MSFKTMGDQRSHTCQVLGRLDHWSQVVVERRLNGAGSHPQRAYPCNELIVMLAGRSLVRRAGDGKSEESLATTGTAWTGPAGFFETAELSDAIHCVHICLPASLMNHSALADYGVDPSKIELAFVGGFADPLLHAFGQAYDGLLERPSQPTDRLFVDGLTAALAAHLIANYTIGRWKPHPAPRGLDSRRLKRVLDYIDSHLGEIISLDQLATEACLSPFHFSRLFRAATGITPHRYLTNRRIESAKAALSLGRHSIQEVAFKVGFSSQASFVRAFGKCTGLTPGQYRSSCQNRGTMPTPS